MTMPVVEGALVSRVFAPVRVHLLTKSEEKERLLAVSLILLSLSVGTSRRETWERARGRIRQLPSASKIETHNEDQRTSTALLVV